MERIENGIVVFTGRDTTVKFSFEDGRITKTSTTTAVYTEDGRMADVITTVERSDDVSFYADAKFDNFAASTLPRKII